MSSDFVRYSPEIETIEPPHDERDIVRDPAVQTHVRPPSLRLTFQPDVVNGFQYFILGPSTKGLPRD